jgi:hypothetical protein
MKHSLIAVLLPLTSIMLLTGCTSAQQRRVEHARNQQRERAAAVAAMVDLRCNGKDAPPGTHVKHNVKQRCGLIFNEIANVEYWKSFTGSLCAGQADEACGRRFMEMFAARMSERYPEADGNALRTHCRAYPIECMDMRTVERWALSSHNVAIEARYKQRLQELQVGERIRAEAEAAESRQAVANALAAFAEAFQPPPSITCTTTAFGSMSTTSCR